VKITAITKFRNGHLHDALLKAGLTHADLAERLGVCAHTVGQWYRLIKKPGSAMADKLQRVFADAGVYFDPLSAWPDDFIPLEKAISIEQTRDVDALLLNGLTAQAPRELEFHGMSAGDWRSELDEIMPELKPAGRTALEMWSDGKSLKQVSDHLGVGRARAYQIFKDALRVLRRLIGKRIRLQAVGLTEKQIQAMIDEAA